MYVRLPVPNLGFMNLTRRCLFRSLLGAQVRLCLDKKDFIRAQILSRKINPKSFDEIVKADKKARLGPLGCTTPVPPLFQPLGLSTPVPLPC